MPRPRQAAADQGRERECRRRHSDAVPGRIAEERTGCAQRHHAAPRRHGARIAGVVKALLDAGAERQREGRAQHDAADVRRRDEPSEPGGHPACCSIAAPISPCRATSAKRPPTGLASWADPRVSSTLKVVSSSAGASRRGARDDEPESSGPPPSAAMALLETSSQKFFESSGCVSCHHQNITDMAAANLARRA